MSTSSFEEQIAALRELQTIGLTDEERALFGRGPAAIARLIAENRVLRATRERASIVPVFVGFDYSRVVGALHVAEAYELPRADELRRSALFFSFKEQDTGGRVLLCSLGLAALPAFPSETKP